MKEVFKVSVFVIIGIIIISSLVVLKFWKINNDYNDKVKNVAFVDIVLEEDIPNIDSVKIDICDSSYFYLIEQIKDTILDKLFISDRFFPCEVTFTYYFPENRIKKLNVDSFNCAGCSGTNRYELYKDSVNYIYLP